MKMFAWFTMRTVEEYGEHRTKTIELDSILRIRVILTNFHEKLDAIYSVDAQTCLMLTHLSYIFNLSWRLPRLVFDVFKMLVPSLWSWLYLGLSYRVMRQSRYSVSLKLSFSLMYRLSSRFEIFLKQDFFSMFRRRVYLVHWKSNQLENYVYSHGLVLCMVHDTFTFRMESIFVIFLPGRGVYRMASAERCTCHLENV